MNVISTTLSKTEKRIISEDQRMETIYLARESEVFLNPSNACVNHIAH